ncbi:MAG: hypothetical protein MR894_07000 [Akkermansia muciniphila]|nr:hypothetical protein [Akkermansia muciniphila]
MGGGKKVIRLRLSTWQQPVANAHRAYNKPAAVRQHLVSVIRAGPAPFALLSYNSEGFIPPAEMQNLLSSLGRVQTLEHSYQTFRACRNLRSRSSKVKEYLFLLEKS